MLDALALIAAAIASVALLALPFLPLTPSFVAMYEDFDGPLPVVTQLALRPWPAPSLGVAVLALALFGASRRALVPRRLLLAGASLAGVLAVAARGWALYAPVFELAGSIASE